MVGSWCVLGCELDGEVDGEMDVGDDEMGAWPGSLGRLVHAFSNAKTYA